MEGKQRCTVVMQGITSDYGLWWKLGGKWLKREKIKCWDGGLTGGVCTGARGYVCIFVYIHEYIFS